MYCMEDIGRVYNISLIFSLEVSIDMFFSKCIILYTQVKNVVHLQLKYYNWSRNVDHKEWVIIFFYINQF